MLLLALNLFQSHKLFTTFISAFIHYVYIYALIKEGLTLPSINPYEINVITFKEDMWVFKNCVFFASLQCQQVNIHTDYVNFSRQCPSIIY